MKDLISRLRDPDYIFETSDNAKQRSHPHKNTTENALSNKRILLISILNGLFQLFPCFVLAGLMRDFPFSSALLIPWYAVTIFFVWKISAQFSKWQQFILITWLHIPILLGAIWGFHLYSQGYDFFGGIGVRFEELERLSNATMNYEAIHYFAPLMFWALCSWLFSFGVLYWFVRKIQASVQGGHLSGGNFIKYGLVSYWPAVGICCLFAAVVFMYLQRA